MREEKVAPAAQQSKEFTPIQRLMRSFKELKGINPDNADWDKKHFSRHIKAGRELLSVFDGDADTAIKYMQLKKREWGTLVDWGIEGVIRAASRDTRLYSGTDLFTPRLDTSAATREFLKSQGEF